MSGNRNNGNLQIGIFSGSFNPIHVGHLALANYLCEYEGLDEVWFLVTPRNPLKQGQEMMDDDFRLHLVKLAVEGYSKFSTSDFEFHLPKPSYTVFTMEKLREAYPHYTFHLIIGSDNWQLFSRWYQWERILAENRLIIYPRAGYPVNETTLPEQVKLSSAPTFEISSTFIRRSLAEGKDVRYFLHPAVYEALMRQ